MGSWIVLRPSVTLSTAQRLTAVNGKEYGGVITKYADGNYGYNLFAGDKVTPGIPATVSFPTTGSIGMEFHSHTGNTPPSITDLQVLSPGTQGYVITRDGAIYNYSTTVTPLGGGVSQYTYNVNVVQPSPSSQTAIYNYTPDIVNDSAGPP